MEPLTQKHAQQRHRGNPKSVVSVRVDPKLLAEIDSYGDDTGLSRSAAIADLCTRSLRGGAQVQREMRREITMLKARLEAATAALSR